MTHCLGHFLGHVRECETVVNIINAHQMQILVYSDSIYLLENCNKVIREPETRQEIFLSFAHCYVSRCYHDIH